MKMKHLWRTLLCAIMIAALMAVGVWAEEEPIVNLEDATGEDGITVDAGEALPDDGALDLDGMALEGLELEGLELPGLDQEEPAAAANAAEPNKKKEEEYGKHWVRPAYGYYKIVGINGHGNGQELWYDQNEDYDEYWISKNLRWKDEGTIWYLDAGQYDGSYRIKWAEDLSYHIADVYGWYVNDDEVVEVIKDHIHSPVVDSQDIFIYNIKEIPRN